MGYGPSEAGMETTQLNQENIELLNRQREDLQELNTVGLEYWWLTLFDL